MKLWELMERVTGKIAPQDEKGNRVINCWDAACLTGKYHLKCESCMLNNFKDEKILEKEIEKR